MAYSEDKDALKIFISYASEDQDIATLVKTTLKTAFSNNINIVMMSEFPFGQNWRTIIQKSISDTDVMIVIATGQLKPSHSFTGGEVGSFEQSIFVQPQTKRWPEISRCIIPFAVLAKVPDTVNDYEGITLNLDNLRDIQFEPATLDNNLKRLQDEQGATNKPNWLKFFLDIQTLLDSRGTGSASAPMSVLDERIGILRSIAFQLVNGVVGIMLGRERDRQTPKAKLILRTKPGSVSLGQSAQISDMTVEFVGDVSNIFGPSVFSGTRYTWDELTANLDYDVATQWKKALQILISTSKDSLYLNDNSIISYDSKQLFRIFTSAIVRYYDNSLEYQVYAIEMLHEQDIGDENTSLLLHAIEVSLGYRSMFLEDKSRFSAAGFKSTPPAEFLDKTSEMIDLLVMLLLKSEQYDLNEPENILAIIGTKGADRVRENYVAWDSAKKDLYTCAKSVLSKKNSMSKSDQDALIKAVQKFCDDTKDMNTFYTVAVIEKLQKILAETSRQLSPPLVDGHVAAPQLAAPKASGKSQKAQAR